jgi:predicted double-glycine peptidase
MPPRARDINGIFTSKRRIILFVTTLAVWIVHILFMYNHSLAVDALPDKFPDSTPDGVVYQTTNYSCGPASLATLFSFYHIEKSERDWAQLAGTGVANGTRLPGLVNAAKEFGFETLELNPSYDQLELIQYPSVIFQSRLYHIVTFWGLESNGDLIIRDPVLGHVTWTPWEYEYNTPIQPVLLLFYRGTIPACNSESYPYEIQRYQNMLKDVGYYNGRLNGEWSNTFISSIKNFQRKMNIPISGEIDKPTFIYLEGMWLNNRSGPPGPFMRMDKIPSGDSSSNITTININP